MTTRWLMFASALAVLGVAAWSTVSEHRALGLVAAALVALFFGLSFMRGAEQPVGWTWDRALIVVLAISLIVLQATR